MQTSLHWPNYITKVAIKQTDRHTEIPESFENLVETSKECVLKFSKGYIIQYSRYPKGLKPTKWLTDMQVIQNC